MAQDFLPLDLKRLLVATLKEIGVTPLKATCERDLIDPSLLRVRVEIDLNGKVQAFGYNHRSYSATSTLDPSTAMSIALDVKQAIRTTLTAYLFAVVTNTHPYLEFVTKELPFAPLVGDQEPEGLSIGQSRLVVRWQIKSPFDLHQARYVAFEQFVRNEPPEGLNSVLAYTATGTFYAKMFDSDFTHKVRHLNSLRLLLSRATDGLAGARLLVDTHYYTKHILALYGLKSDEWKNNDAPN